MTEEKRRKVTSADPTQEQRAARIPQRPLLTPYWRSTSASCPLAPIFGGDITLTQEGEDE